MWFWKNLRTVAALAALVLLASAGRAAPSGGRIGLLVVSRQSDAAVEQRAVAVATRLEALRGQAGYEADRLPILVYHFDVAAERDYCERALHIGSAEVPLVGVVQVGPDGVTPTAVTFRLPRVREAEAAATAAMVRAQKGLDAAFQQAVAHLRRLRVNPQGRTEYENPRDGSVLVRVPGGAFTMGSDPAFVEERERAAHLSYPVLDVELPARSVTLGEFYIGKFDVTVRQFRRFVKASGYRPATAAWSRYAAAAEDRPVASVAWPDAVAYCAWAGLELPSEAQWEKAARGTDARIYPWGNEWDAARCHNAAAKGFASRPAPVGSYPKGVSPVGCHDMEGNVAQWTASWFDRYPGNRSDAHSLSYGRRYRVVRGGGFSERRPAVFLHCAFRLPADPSDVDPSRGFRVALSP